MMRSLFSGVAGLKTHQVKMDVIGNNIANVNTTSFKSQSITFSDLMYQTTQRASRATETTGGVNARQIGLGAKSGAIATAITQQGATETTNNPFDMRITGDAFFVVNNGNQTMFTRDGSFYVDGAGNLAMQSTGYFVYGWSAQEDPETGAITVNTNGGIGKLQIMSAENMTYPPEGTTEGLVSGNIDAHDTNITSDNGKTVTLEFYDNLGYLYTAKFAVRDVDNLEHTYTMTLEDILDSKGNTIGAEKLSHVTFTDKVDNEESVYNIRDSWTKKVTTVNYTATVGAKNASYKNSAGSTAYSGIPVSGSISSLVAKAPQLLGNVYNLSVDTGEEGSVNSTDYYSINTDGSINVYEVTPKDNEEKNLGSFYKYNSTDTTVTYGTAEIDTYAVLSRSLDITSKGDLGTKEKEVLNKMFGLNVDELDFSDGKTYAYTLSSDGTSGLTLYTNSYETTYADLTDNWHKVSVGTDNTITFNNYNSGQNKKIALTGTGITSDIEDVYGIKRTSYTNPDEATYEIDAGTGRITITQKTTTAAGTEDHCIGQIDSAYTYDATTRKWSDGTNTISSTGSITAETAGELRDVLGIEATVTFPSKNDNDSEEYTYTYTINADTGAVSVIKNITGVTYKPFNPIPYKSTTYTFYSAEGNAVFAEKGGAANQTFALSGVFDKSSTTQNLLACYGKTTAEYPSSEGNINYTYSYTIDPENGKMSIIRKATVTSGSDEYANKNEFAVCAKTDSTITFKNYKSEKTYTYNLTGTINGLTNTQKNILNDIFGFTPAANDVTYEISGDGTILTVGQRNTASLKQYSISKTETENQLTFEIEVDETTATYTNASEDGKVIYDKIPRTGYVSEIYDATLTADFFNDVYGYTVDKESGSYENMTYHILDDGTLQIVNNSITMKYNAKTGAIEQPTEKIILNFDQDALIDGQPKMAGFTDVNMDLSPTTNYNTMATSTIGAVKGDKQSLKTGRAVGEMNGVTIGKDGTIYATYSNGQTKLLGQIATAEFANASGLEKNGDNLYTQTLNSGEATIQDVTTDGGYITTGVLEMSNVDLSSEFTSMITTQRGFQANSRIITVSDTLLEELTNLKR